MDLLKEMKLENKARYFVEEIPKVPEEKYVMAILLRETKSHCVFTTEIDVLNTVRVEAGKQNPEMIDRVVMFKRKQVAPERRTGKRLLREYGFMKLEDCYLMENLCCACPDCLLYGSISAEKSQKSRIYYDNAYTIREYDQVHERLTLTAIDEVTGRPGEAFADVDHLKPCVILPSIITLHSVTPEEFVYALMNVMRTSRYGAQVTRIGSIENHILGFVFSSAECLSNLDLTQILYDQLIAEKKPKPLRDLTYGDVEKHVKNIIEGLVNKKPVRSEIFIGAEFQQFLNEFIQMCQKEENIKSILQSLMKKARNFVKA